MSCYNSIPTALVVVVAMTWTSGTMRRTPRSLRLSYGTVIGTTNIVSLGTKRPERYAAVPDNLALNHKKIVRHIFCATTTCSFSVANITTDTHQPLMMIHTHTCLVFTIARSQLLKSILHWTRKQYCHIICSCHSINYCICTFGFHKALIKTETGPWSYKKYLYSLRWRRLIISPH